MMLFSDALKMIALGKKVRRPEGPIIELHHATLPLCSQMLLNSTGVEQFLNNNWIYVRIPIAAGCDSPKLFSDDEINANDWELVL
jgi:hypothetical protein